MNIGECESVSSGSGVFSLRARLHHLLYSCLLEGLIRTMVMSNHLCYIKQTSNAANQGVREHEGPALRRRAVNIKEVKVYNSLATNVYLLTRRTEDGLVFRGLE